MFFIAASATDAWAQPQALSISMTQVDHADGVIRPTVMLPCHGDICRAQFALFVDGVERKVQVEARLSGRVVWIGFDPVNAQQTRFFLEPTINRPVTVNLDRRGTANHEIKICQYPAPVDDRGGVTRPVLRGCREAAAIVRVDIVVQGIPREPLSNGGRVKPLPSL